MAMMKVTKSMLVIIKIVSRRIIVDIRTLIDEVPKSELHLHLRGAITYDVFKGLLHKYEDVDVLGSIHNKKREELLSQPNIRAFLKADIQHDNEIENLFNYFNFDEFLNTYIFVGFYIRDIDDFRFLTKGVLRNLQKQNIVYAEISVSILAYLNNGISIEDISDCLSEMSVYNGVRVNWIVAFGRTYGNKSALDLLKRIILLRNKDIIGITLGGNELLYSPKDFQEVCDLARKSGMKLTIHSGEICGPETIWETIKYLKPDRIGHGVRASEDYELLNYLAEAKIPIEVCPTSNLCTGMYKTYEKHPITTLINKSIIVTVNTDDPTFFNVSLVDEYMHLYKEMGVSIDNIYEILCNSYRYSFLSKGEIARYLSAMQSKWDELIMKIE